MTVRGEIVEFTLIDVSAELDLSRVRDVVGQSARKAPLVARSPSPPYATFPSPLQAEVDPGWLGDVPQGAKLTVRLHSIGTVAVRARIPFEVASLADVAPLAASPRIGDRPVQSLLEGVARRVQADVRHAFVEPYYATVEPEVYSAICITDGAGGAERVLAEEREAVAALVQGEPEIGRLSREAIESAFARTVRYYRDDAVMLGWDNSVVIAPAGTYDDLLDVLELVNLELLELRTYDAYLDRTLDESFEALQRLWAPGGLFRSARAALAHMSELRAEVARLTDSLRDTGKMFGDWYLGKVHQRLRDRFHLAAWETGVRDKMETLEDMFHLAEEETNHRRALVLETMIVLLFVIDLILIFVLAKA